MSPNVKLVLVLLIIAGVYYLGFDHGSRRTQSEYLARDNQALEAKQARILELQQKVTTLEYNLSQKTEAIANAREHLDEEINDHVSKLSDPNRAIIGADGLRLYNKARSGELP